MIIVDENIEQHWINLFREKGFEVLSIRDTYWGIKDRQIVELVRENNALLVTEDKDFGELVFAHGFKDIAVILLRYDQPKYETIQAFLLQAINDYFANKRNCFITITKNKIRIINL